MTKILVLWANETTPNLGVRALAAGSKTLIHRAWPDADVRIHGTGAGGQLGNDGPMNIGHLPPLVKERFVGRRGLEDWLTSFDLVFDTRAGDSFADVYGRRRLLKMSVITEFARQWGVPVVLGPQTIGPFERWESRVLARRTLRIATRVMVRDPRSGEEAARLGRAPDLVTTDVVFALPRPTPPKSRDVVLNVSGLLWVDNPHVAAEAYRRLVVDLIQSLEASGRTVSLLAHVASHPHNTVDNDAHALQDIQRNVPGDREILVPRSLDEARATLGSASVVIGSRMHACLNALSVGTPAIPLAYSRKFVPLLQSLGWPIMVDLRDPADPLPAILEAVERADLADSVADLVRRGDRSMTDAARLLEELG